MSKSHGIAEAMVARLNAHLQLAGVTAIVSRQKELANEVERKVLKAGGAAIIVQFEGFTNPNGAVSGQVTVTRRYTASIYTRPIMRDGETPADEVVEFVAKTLHNWEMDENATQAAEIQVTGCDVLPDKSYLIYQLDIDCLSRL
jgi:hypothetical protein